MRAQAMSGTWQGQDIPNSYPSGVVASWLTRETATTAKFRLAWVVGHDRAATNSRTDAAPVPVHGFWTGVTDGLAQFVLQSRVQGGERPKRWNLRDDIARPDGTVPAIDRAALTFWDRGKP